MPYLAKRIEFANFGAIGLPNPVINYLRLFYNDTAVQGNIANLMCAYSFSGADHILFGSDFPPINTDLLYATIKSMQEMNIPDSEKELILNKNARKLLKLQL